MSNHEAILALMEVVGSINSLDQRLNFFKDLCTPQELEAMASRWQVVLLLEKGEAYRAIQESTGVSLATITRVARSLRLGAGGYASIAHRHQHK